MTTMFTTPDSRRVRHLRDRVPTIARECGWPDDHPMINALMNDPAVLSGYDDQSLRRLLDPGSAENICKTNNQLLIVTPFGRPYGPTPLDIADRLLPEGWENEWIGAVLESNTTILIDNNGDEIIRFNGAGCGNRAVLSEARYLLVHYMFHLLPDVSHLRLMEELDTLTASLEGDRKSHIYNLVRLVNGPTGWEIIPS